MFHFRLAVIPIIALPLLMLSVDMSPANARPWRPSQIPHGADVDPQFGGCIACHVTRSGGTERNPFGQEVEKRVTVNGFEEFWDASLAMMDSDGDGFTNGEELQDPTGSWVSGEPSPGDASLVSNPGDPNSIPPGANTPTPTPTTGATSTPTPEVTATPTATPTPEPVPPITDAFTALLTGEQAVPSVTTTARGTALVGLNAAEDTLFYRLYVNGAADITAAHIHLGAPGEMGPVDIPLAGAFDTFVSGSAAVSATQVAALRSGNYYVNVHTSTHQGGEIRGQIVDVPLTFEAHPRGAFVIDSVTDTAGLALYQLGIDDTLTTGVWTMRESGLQNILASHLHTGALDAEGGVRVPLTQGFVGSASGAFTIDNSGFIDDLFSEGLYVNIHTQAYGNGELRDQVRYLGGTAPSLYLAVLDGANENPPVMTDARGVALVRVDASGSYLEFWLSVRDAQDIRMAHIHRGGAAANGPVLMTLSGDPFGGFVSGAGPVDGDMLADLDAGMLYVNVHTGANLSGEVRGQLKQISSLTFRAMLDGLQQPTPVASDGHGMAELDIEPTLRVGDMRLSVFGLDDITLSHIHDGDIGTNGGVAIGLTGAFSETANVGVRPSPEDINSLLSEGYYVNVHTSTHQSGEIRGQLGIPEGPRVAPPSSSDVNGDGIVNADDLLLIIQDWHSAP